MDKINHRAAARPGTPAAGTPGDLSPAAALAYCQVTSGNIRAFYSGAAWKHAAAAARERDRNECQDCKKRGLYSPAGAVHHVVYLRSDPRRALDQSNLVTLCTACHERRHAGDAGTAGAAPSFRNEEQW